MLALLVALACSSPCPRCASCDCPEAVDTGEPVEDTGVDTADTDVDTGDPDPDPLGLVGEWGVLPCLPEYNHGDACVGWNSDWRSWPELDVRQMEGASGVLSTALVVEVGGSAEVTYLVSYTRGDLEIVQDYVTRSYSPWEYVGSDAYDIHGDTWTVLPLGESLSVVNAHASAMLAPL